MRWFRWNSFTIIGLILLIVGIYGFIKGAGFEFDAGLPAEPGEPWFYMLTGILMIVNGVVLPRPLVSESPATTPSRQPAGEPAATPSAPVQTK